MIVEINNHQPNPINEQYDNIALLLVTYYNGEYSAVVFYNAITEKWELPTIQSEPNHPMYIGICDNDQLHHYLTKLDDQVGSIFYLDTFQLTIGDTGNTIYACATINAICYEQIKQITENNGLLYVKAGCIPFINLPDIRENPIYEGELITPLTIQVMSSGRIVDEN